MIITVISKCLNQMCKDNGKTDINKFVTLVPVGQYSLPANPQNVIVDNNVSGILIDIPAVNDITRDSKIISSVLNKQLGNVPLIKAILKFDAFFAEFMRRQDAQNESDKLFKALDFVISKSQIVHSDN